MVLSFRLNLVLRMAILVACVIAVVGLYTSWRIGDAAEELSNRVIRQTSNLIDQRVGGLLEKAEGQARLVAGITKPTFSADLNPAVDSSRFPLLAAQILETIRANPEFGAITVTLDRTGEYVQVAQTPSGALRVQTSELIAGGNRVQKDWIPFGNRLRETAQTTVDILDPRDEEPYQATASARKTTWSSTRIVRNLPTGPTAGTICSTPILNAEGEFLGVVSVTLTLSDLSLFLRTIKVSERGFASIFEQKSEGDPVLIADPNPGRMFTLTSGEEQMVELSKSSDLLLRSIASEVANVPRMQPADFQVARRNVENETYLMGIGSVSGESRPMWALAVVVPQSDFLDWSRETVLFFLSFAAIAIGTGVGVAWLLANRVAKPLQELALETDRIRALDFEERQVQRSNIQEIDLLSDSFESLKAGLRSMEKLVPTDYARSLISSGQEAKLGGERRHITTYFGDIVGFTRLSHQLPPEELVEVLTEYLDVLSSQVLEYGGTLDKFNGDDVMAFWGAPIITTDHATMAVRSALQSIDALETLHSEWREQGRPVLSASFGIATGDVMVGNVGSRKRMNYTVIGDSVNLASRLQSLNKFYRTHILASDQTKVESGDIFLWRIVDLVEVVNRDEPVAIYEPLCLLREASADEIKAAELTEQAFRTYVKRQFVRAAQIYDEVLALRPNDGPASILHARCLKYTQDPPAENWDGSFEMMLK